MSKLFIFAIGGTGERVLRSATMLFAAGVPAFKKYDIYPIIIDYDAKCQAKQEARDLLKLYQQINTLSFKDNRVIDQNDTDDNNGQFFGPTIKQMNGLKDFVWEFDPGKTKLKFRKKINYDGINNELINTKYLLDSLYDDSFDSTTELNLELTVGFKGNPNIGTVVFNKLIECDQYRIFDGLYDAEQGDKVVIIGSLFGGTGASGIPVIAKAIKNDKPSASICALMIEPYFAPEHKNGGAIDSRLYYAKTKSAIKYYEDSKIVGDTIQSAYFIGDPYPTIVKYSEEGENQINFANPVEFISALAIEHYLSSDKGQYKFGLFKSITVDQKEKTNYCRIYNADFDSNTKNNVLRYFDALTIALKYNSEQICSGAIKSSDSYVGMLGIMNFINEIKQKKHSNHKDKLQDIIIWLSDFYEKYRKWIDELNFQGDESQGLHPNSHTLPMYKTDGDFGDLVAEAPRNVQERRIIGIHLPGQKAPGRYSDVSHDMVKANMNTFLSSRGHIQDSTLAHKDTFVFMDIIRAAGMKITKNR